MSAWPIIILATASLSQPNFVGQDYFVESKTTNVFGVRDAQQIADRSRLYEPETSRKFVDIDLKTLATPSLPSSSIRALAQLRAFEAWGRNWDGEGAAAPKVLALNAAAEVLGLLEDEILATPLVALDSSGEPNFIMMSDGREMSVTVKNHNTLAFYVFGNNFEDGGIVHYDGDKLPRKLVKALRSVGFA